MRRPAACALFVAAALSMAACQTDKGSNRSAPATATSTSTTIAPPPSTGVPGSSTTTPTQDPRVPADAPQDVVIGGVKLQAVALGTGTVTDIPRPALGNGLTVVGLLERAQGLVAVVRGLLPQDPGSVYVLGDSAHDPRALGTGVSVVAGPSAHELWIADATSADGLTAVRRADIGQEAPGQVQRLPRGRTLAGFGSGGLVLSVSPNGDGEVVGPVDLMDPVRGTMIKRLADSGSVVAADGQRAVVLVDGACTTSCTLKIAGPATDRSIDLPAGLVPEPGGVTSAAATVFVGHTNGGPRHIWVLSMTDGTAKDTGMTLPPGAGPAPMAMDAQGTWAFARSGPSTLVGIRVAGATAQALPWTLDPWSAIAVTAGGTCPCRAPASGGAGAIV